MCLRHFPSPCFPAAAPPLAHLFLLLQLALWLSNRHGGTRVIDLVPQQADEVGWRDMDYGAVKEDMFDPFVICSHWINWISFCAQCNKNDAPKIPNLGGASVLCPRDIMHRRKMIHRGRGFIPFPRPSRCFLLSKESG